MAYYYLMAQLPYLLFEQKPPMSSTAFKELALSMLNKKDSALLNNLALDPDPDNAGAQSPNISSYSEPFPSTGCAFIDNYREWERTLRLALAKQRAGKIGRNSDEAAAEPPFFPAEANQAAVKALAREISPLEGESVIDKARWDAIDSFTGSDYFHRNNVFAYYLKLLLLERRFSFNAEKGFTEYKSLYASIIESAHKYGES